ncbi:MAG TPA: hypothetical protein ENK84_01000, partial [Desulfobulbus sp.]|nr:hypothetical protein [Desulfobulbus sp.]
MVLGGETLDLSSFRNGAVTIEQELVKRDLTVNGLGLCIDSLIRRTGCDRGATLTVIDPQGGVQDLASGLIRLCSI